MLCITEPAAAFLERPKPYWVGLACDRCGAPATEHRPGILFGVLDDICRRTSCKGYATLHDPDWVEAKRRAYADELATQRTP